MVWVGQVEVQLLHTPGHTPGSQCFLVPAASWPATRSFERMRADGLSWWRPCGDVRQPAQPAREAPGRDRRVPRPPLLTGVFRSPRRDQALEPGTGASQRRGVAGTVRRVAVDRPASGNRAGPTLVCDDREEGRLPRLHAALEVRARTGRARKCRRGPVRACTGTADHYEVRSPGSSSSRAPSSPRGMCAACGARPTAHSSGSRTSMRTAAPSSIRRPDYRADLGNRARFLHAAAQ